MRKILGRLGVVVVLVGSLSVVGSMPAQAHGTCTTKATITSSNGGATAKATLTCLVNGQAAGHTDADVTVNLVKASNNNVIASASKLCHDPIVGACWKVTASVSHSCIVGQKYFASAVGTAAGHPYSFDTSAQVTCVAQGAVPVGVE